MASLARDLGLTEAEFATALLLQRLYHLINADLNDVCPVCRSGGGVQYYDPVRVVLHCARCADPQSSLSIGESSVSAQLVERLEAKYAKPAAAVEEFNIWVDIPAPPPRVSEPASSLETRVPAAERATPGMAGVIASQRHAPDPAQLTALLEQVVESQKHLHAVVADLAARLGPAALSSSSTPPRRTAATSPVRRRDLRLLQQQDEARLTARRQLSRKNPFRDASFGGA